MLTTYAADGTLTITRPDGSVRVESPDGTLQTTLADGRVQTSLIDGTYTTEYPGGVKVAFTPEGEIVTTLASGELVVRDSSGGLFQQADATAARVPYSGTTPLTAQASNLTLSWQLNGTFITTWLGDSVTLYVGGRQVEQAADGTVTTDYPSGARRVQVSTDVWTFQHADGSQVHHDADGVVVVTLPDGSTITTAADATVSTNLVASSTVTVNADHSISLLDEWGDATLWRSDGTMAVTDTAGSVTAYALDGTTVTSDSDGTVSTLDSDGTTTVAYADGSRWVQYGDGSTSDTTAGGLTTVQTVDGATEERWLDGSALKTLADGKTQTVSLADGSTVTRTASGAVVASPAAGSTLLTQGTDGFWQATAGGVQFTWKTNGDINRLEIDGTITTSRADGWVLQTRPDGALLTTDPNGVAVTREADGSVAVSLDTGELQLDRGGVASTFDGLMRTWLSDGTRLATDAEGAITHTDVNGVQRTQTESGASTFGIAAGVDLTASMSGGLQFTFGDGGSVTMDRTHELRFFDAQGQAFDPSADSAVDGLTVLADGRVLYAAEDGSLLTFTSAAGLPASDVLTDGFDRISIVGPDGTRLTWFANGVIDQHTLDGENTRWVPPGASPVFTSGCVEQSRDGGPVSVWQDSYDYNPSDPRGERLLGTFKEVYDSLNGTDTYFRSNGTVNQYSLNSEGLVDADSRVLTTLPDGFTFVNHGAPADASSCPVQMQRITYREPDIYVHSNQDLPSPGNGGYQESADTPTPVEPLEWEYRSSTWSPESFVTPYGDQFEALYKANKHLVLGDFDADGWFVPGPYTAESSVRIEAHVHTADVHTILDDNTVISSGSTSHVTYYYYLDGASTPALVSDILYQPRVIGPPLVGGKSATLLVDKNYSNMDLPEDLQCEKVNGFASYTRELIDNEYEGDKDFKYTFFDANNHEIKSVIVDDTHVAAIGSWFPNYAPPVSPLARIQETAGFKLLPEALFSEEDIPDTTTAETAPTSNPKVVGNDSVDTTSDATGQLTSESFNQYYTAGSAFSTGSYSKTAFNTTTSSISLASGSTAGTYTSAVYDAGRSTQVTGLKWAADVPEGASLRFQVAVSDTAEGPWNFVGPDGTATSWFTDSGTAPTIASTGRYVRYRADVQSGTSQLGSPTFSSVSMTYAGTTPPQRNTYTYNATGNITKVVTETAAGVTTDIRDDATWPAGDRINSLSQLLRRDVTGPDGVTTTWRYTYDAAGNMTSKSDGTSTTLYAWDGESHLTQATLPDGTTIDYTYNEFGLMLSSKKSTDENPTTFVWAGEDMVQETAPDGVVTHYNYSGGQMVSFERGGETYTVYADRLGHVRAAASALREEAFTGTYDAWGNQLNVVDNVPGGLMYRFVGAYGVNWMPELGMYCMRHRFYDAESQQFISSDPLRTNTNFYEYASDRPGVQIDPTGLVPVFTDYLRKTGGVTFGSALLQDAWNFALPYLKQSALGKEIVREFQNQTSATTVEFSPYCDVGGNGIVTPLLPGVRRVRVDASMANDFESKSFREIRKVEIALVLAHEGFHVLQHKYNPDRKATSSSLEEEAYAHDFAASIFSLMIAQSSRVREWYHTRENFWRVREKLEGVADCHSFKDKISYLKSREYKDYPYRDPKVKLHIVPYPVPHFPNN